MQRLEVSGAVRPLKWPLGVKWLRRQAGRVGTTPKVQFKDVFPEFCLEAGEVCSCASCT
jgi:hypothetical protein